MINPSQPVRLRDCPPVPGKVTEIGSDGLLTVAFEGGTSGRYPVAALEQVEEDKSWPPAGMETKTPRLEVK